MYELFERYTVFKQSIAGRKLYTKYDVIIGDFVSYSAVFYDFNNCVLGNLNEFFVYVFSCIGRYSICTACLSVFLFFTVLLLPSW